MKKIASTVDDRVTINYTLYKNKFDEVITLLDALNNPRIFNASNGSFSPSLFESVMVIAAQNIDYIKENNNILNCYIEKLKTDSEFKKHSGTASSSKHRNKRRLERADSLFKELSK